MKSVSFNRLSISQRLTLSFLVVIFVGSILLSLPFSQVPDVTTTYLDHLFTTVSMVCVTGLSLVTVSDTYSILGQVICILLMQIGGLGLITLLAVSTVYLRGHLSLKDQLILQESFSHEDNRELKSLLISIYRFTVCVEIGTAFLLSWRFVPEFGWAKGLFSSLFIAVSAFCNAGFDNLGTTSLKAYANDVYLNLVVSGAIIAGGLGFIIWYDLKQGVIKSFRAKRVSFKGLWRRLSSHSRLVLKATGLVLLIGTGSTWLSELHNPETIGGLSLVNQGVTSFFQSVTMRTAGFATLDYEATRPVTNFLYILQMIIGGAPGGTAGGIKITTVAVMFLLFQSAMRGEKEIHFERRILAKNTIKQTITVIMFFFLVYIIGIILLLASQPHLETDALIFEVSSALATAGVSMNLTPQLTSFGKIIVMGLMFIGRVGPSTVLLSLVMKKKKEVRYARTNIYIG